MKVKGYFKINPERKCYISEITKKILLTKYSLLTGVFCFNMLRRIVNNKTALEMFCKTKNQKGYFLIFFFDALAFLLKSRASPIQ